MIHHLSIPARNPRNVASVLTELMGGKLTGFGPYGNSYIAWMGDEYGTAIEIYPRGTELIPDRGRGQANFRHHDASSPHSATHAAMSVGASREEIMALADREGWKALELSRGSNKVIEFWIENAVMLELMTDEMRRDYIAATQKYRS